MLASHHFPQMRKPHNSHRTAPWEFSCFLPSTHSERQSVWKWGTIKSNATQQLTRMHRADCRRCFQQRKILCNKLIQTELFWFRRDQYVMNVTSVLSVPQHQTGASWSGLLRNIWIFNRAYGGALFTLQTVLTCCQIAHSGRGCVRLRCWAEKGPFPVLIALDNVVVGQPFFLSFQPLFGRCTIHYHVPTSLPLWPISFASWTQNAAPQQPTNQPTIDLRQHTCSKAHVDVPRSVAIPAFDHIAVISNRQWNVFSNRNCPYANDCSSRFKTPMRQC